MTNTRLETQQNNLETKVCVVSYNLLHAKTSFPEHQIFNLTFYGNDESVRPCDDHTDLSTRQYFPTRFSASDKRGLICRTNRIFNEIRRFLKGPRSLVIAPNILNAYPYQMGYRRSLSFSTVQAVLNSVLPWPLGMSLEAKCKTLTKRWSSENVHKTV
jgi:hypothetical protein